MTGHCTLRRPAGWKLAAFRCRVGDGPDLRSIWLIQHVAHLHSCPWASVCTSQPETGKRARRLGCCLLPLRCSQHRPAWRVMERRGDPEAPLAPQSPSALRLAGLPPEARPLGRRVLWPVPGARRPHDHAPISTAPKSITCELPQRTITNPCIDVPTSSTRPLPYLLAELLVDPFVPALAVFADED